MKQNQNPPILTQLSSKNKLNDQIKYEHLNNLVDQINSLNLSWKAGVHQEFVGMSFFEIKKKLGMRNNKSAKSSIQNNLSFIQLDKGKVETDNDMDLKEFLEKINKEEKLIESLSISTETHSNGKKNAEAEEECCVPHLTKTAEVSTVGSTAGPDSSIVTDYAEVSKYINMDIKDIDEKELSKNWDWRNVGGVSYVPSIKSQGDCGSCYVFSAVTSLEGRLRVQTNNQDQTALSKQFPISCNFYSEGCDGGYPVLVGKFLNEFEVVPESCMPYKAANTQCSTVCDYTKNPKKYTVSKYGYLGGFYPGSSEADILKELRARGPMPGNIRVPWTFNYYKSGIFSEGEVLKKKYKSHF